MKYLLVIIKMAISINAYSTCIVVYFINDTTLYLASDSRETLSNINRTISIDDFKCKIKNYGSDYISMTGIIELGKISPDLSLIYDSIYTHISDSKYFLNDAIKYTTGKFSEFIKYYKNDSNILNKYRTIDGVYLILLYIKRSNNLMSIIRHAFIQKDLALAKVSLQVDTLYFNPPMKTFKCFGEKDFCESKLQYYIEHNYDGKQINYPNESIEQILSEAINYQSQNTPKSVGGLVTILKITPHTSTWIQNALHCK